MLAMVSLPFYLQTVLGRSEVETGLLLTPRPLATMVMAPLAGYLIERVHAGLLGALGLLVMASGLFAPGITSCRAVRSEYHLADDSLRRRVWFISIPQ